MELKTVKLKARCRGCGALLFVLNIEEGEEFTQSREPLKKHGLEGKCRRCSQLYYIDKMGDTTLNYNLKIEEE